ncbi:hypothetical protein JCM10450v2_006362 [Rhodotorula kratochvilovae]
MGFPLDVVRLILEHLSDTLEEPERRQEGARLARVCRLWREPAYDLAWRHLTLEKGYVVALAQHLLANKRVLHFVRRLTIISTDAQLLASAILPPRHDAPFIEVMRSCTGLLSLTMPASFAGADLLGPASLSPFASTLQGLATYDLSADNRGGQLAGLHSILSRFRNLEYLQIRLVKFNDTKWTFSPTGLTPKLPIQKLVIILPPEGQNKYLGALSDVVVSLIDRDTFRTLVLQNFVGDLTLLRWLPRCALFRELTVCAQSSLHLRAALPALGNILSELHSLKIFVLSSLTPIVSPTPLLLAAFLNALPSSVRIGHVCHVFFAADARVAELGRPLVEEDSAAPAVRVTITSEDGQQLRYVTVRKLKLWRGSTAARWVIVAG